jgi:predicted permease
LRILRRLGYLLHQRRAEADLAEELEFHRAMNQEQGGDPNALGNTTLAREEARAVWIAPWLQSVWQDASYACRNLRRQPGFTLVALLTLGAAIGLNASLFTVFHLIALRPWPVKDAGRVVSVTEDGRGFSLAEYRHLASNARLLAGLSAKQDLQVRLGGERGLDTPCTFVSGNYFALLGVEMELGRGFREEEDRFEAPRAVAVLSHAFWQEQFKGNPEILDQKIRIEGQEFTVVGVASRDFTLDRSLWLPMAAIPMLRLQDAASIQALFSQPAACCAVVVGRLLPGVSSASAQAELSRLSGSFRQSAGLKHSAVELTRALAYPDSKGTVLPLFGLMFLAVMLVLLLTCSNVGNLLLARAEARRPEIQVRLSLGATRLRIVRQLLTESLILAVAAAGLGLLSAYRLPAIVMQLFQKGAPLRLVPDGTVLAYAIALAVFSCICFGLAPALQSTRPPDGRSRLRNILLAVEVGLSVVLLMGASLVSKAVARSRSLDPGFSIADVSVVSFEFPSAYDGDAFHRRLLAGLQSAPGIGSYGLAEREPLTSRGFAVANSPLGWIEAQYVTPGYFEVLRIPIVAGRALNSSDEAEHGILVNEAMARRYWKGDALGKRMKIGEAVREVAGVVRDTYSTGGGLERIDPVVYQPMPAKRSSRFGRRAPPKVFVRTAPGAVDAIAAVSAGIDPSVRVTAEPLSDSVDRWLEPARTGAVLAGVLGVFALVLATVGMSGVFGYVVQQRTKEIGIRMALGAQPAQVIGLVLLGASRAVLAGVAAGLLAAAPISRVVQHRLSGVNPVDPAAYFLVVSVLAVAALAASYLPARRATRIDPLSALRCQ